MTLDRDIEDTREPTVDYDSNDEDCPMDEKERADRLEGMVTRMTKTIISLRKAIRQLNITYDAVVGGILEDHPEIECAGYIDGYITELKKQIEDANDKIYEIVNWTKAYPITVFHKPTSEEWKKANEALKAAGFWGIDCFSADTMRHVVEGVKEIAEKALESLK
jgi:hypothetical protein